MNLAQLFIIGAANDSPADNYENPIDSRLVWCYLDLAKPRFKRI